MHNVFIITGGTGFIGSRLTNHLLAQGKKVYILSRQAKQSANANLEYIQWNPALQTIAKPIADVNVCVVHLAGAGVADKRWDNARKTEIINSRVESTTYLHALIKNKLINATQVVSASAIGYYATSNNSLSENDTAATDYLGQTCVAWENAVLQMKELQLPIAILRIGIVLGIGGGAMAEFIKPLRVHIAGIPGNGSQLYSCIHIDDVVGIIIHCANNQLNDVYNTVCPEVVTCKKLITTLAAAYCGWYIAIPSPNFVIKLILGEMSTEILKSATVSSKKIESAGYKFKYATIESAMQQITTELKQPKKTL